MKWRPLSLWPYEGMTCVDSPKYADASTSTTKAAGAGVSCWLFAGVAGVVLPRNG